VLDEFSSPSVAGVAFLSGGQSNQRASAHLNAMNVKFGLIAPWPLTFSYARAIQQPALEKWRVRRRICPQHRNSFIIGLCNVLHIWANTAPKWKRKKSLHLHKGLAALRRSLRSAGFRWGANLAFAPQPSLTKFCYNLTYTMH